VVSAITQGESLWDGYLEWLKEDVSNISHALEREGYNVLEAMVSEPKDVWRKTTPQFAVTVELAGDENGLDGWDTDIAIDTLKEFANEQGSCYCLKAIVTCRNSGVNLGDACLGGIHTTKSLRDANGHEHGYLAELVYEAIQEAKAKLSLHEALAA
jgi:hypothetical protein